MSPMLPASARKIPAFIPAPLVWSLPAACGERIAEQLGQLILVRQPAEPGLHLPLGGALALLGAAVGLSPGQGRLSAHLAAFAVAVPSEHGGLLRRRWRPDRPPGLRRRRGHWRWPGPPGSHYGPSARCPGPPRRGRARRRSGASRWRT